jgi:Ca-activated chloride channel family protein
MRLRSGRPFDDELRLLRDAEGLPAETRRGMLVELATRLEKLLAIRTDPALDPLRALLARLTSTELDTDLDGLWLATREALEDFQRQLAASAPRTTFWKR